MVLSWGGFALLQYHDIGYFSIRYYGISSPAGDGKLPNNWSVFRYLAGNFDGVKVLETPANPLYLGNRLYTPIRSFIFYFVLFLIAYNAIGICKLCNNYGNCVHDSAVSMKLNLLLAMMWFLLRGCVFGWTPWSLYTLIKGRIFYTNMKHLNNFSQNTTD